MRSANPRPAALLLLLVFSVLGASRAVAAEHPRLFFAADDIDAIRARAGTPQLQPTADRLKARAQWLLTAAPLVPSLAKRGDQDPPGELKGLESARRLQGRVATLALAYRLSGERAFRDAAVAELRRAIDEWRIWVDTAHDPPYDLMSGELAMTLAIGYDWLYPDLSREERELLERGGERALTNYLEGVEKKRFWFTASHNWNPVCNGGAALLALALGDVSPRAARVLELAVPAMDHYWNHLAEDGGWDEGTGYWAYGHRYAFMAAEALGRAGGRGGWDRFAQPGPARTGFFPIVFNPGTKLSASFGDSAGRAEDALYYLLARQIPRARVRVVPGPRRPARRHLGRLAPGRAEADLAARWRGLVARATGGRLRPATGHASALRQHRLGHARVATARSGVVPGVQERLARREPHPPRPQHHLHRLR